jgi:glycosyltransferase involved in cell wall biosynthesis
MKIDILIPDFADFGAQRVAINAVNGLHGGHDVRLVVHSEVGPFRGYVAPGVEIVVLDEHAVALPKVRVLSRLLAYRCLARRGSWVVAYSPMMNVAAIVAGLWRRDVRVAIQEHGLVSAVLEDRGAYGFWFSMAYRWLVLPGYRFADHFIVITEAIRDDLVGRFGFPPGFFSVLRNPLDLRGIGRLSREGLPRGPWEKRPYILGVGRICTQKDFSRLIGAFGRLAKGWPDVDLVIVGKGDEDEMRKLADCARRTGVESRVHFAGFQKNPYVFMARAKVFCLTSLWEGLPQVLAEAMACGVPVVAHDCPSGPGEMIDNGKTGFVTPYQDEVSLVDKVEQCLRGGKRIERMVERARAWVREEYALEVYVKSLVGVLKRVEAGA